MLQGKTLASPVLRRMQSLDRVTPSLSIFIQKDCCLWKVAEGKGCGGDSSGSFPIQPAWGLLPLWKLLGKLKNIPQDGSEEGNLWSSESGFWK